MSFEVKMKGRDSVFVKDVRNEGYQRGLRVNHDCTPKHEEDCFVLCSIIASGILARYYPTSLGPYRCDQRT
jgi:hypothetical protein